MKSFYGVDLETATIRMGLNGAQPSLAQLQTRSINSGGRALPGAVAAADKGYACLLINGKEGIYAKLSLYSTEDIEMLEVYPPTTELSGTVRWYSTIRTATRAASSIIRPTTSCGSRRHLERAEG